MKILIVDDVPQMVELMRQTLLQSPGLVQASDEIRHALTVSEARFELLRFRPELLILDVVLPGEGPTALLMELPVKDLPVILVSAAPVGPECEWLQTFPQVLGCLTKWGWDDLDRGGEQILALLERKP